MSQMVKSDEKKEEMSCQSVLKKLQQPEMSCGSTTCRLSPIWFGLQRSRWIIISTNATQMQMKIEEIFVPTCQRNYVDFAQQSLP